MKVKALQGNAPILHISWESESEILQWGVGKIVEASLSLDDKLE